jgi:hypothetical protein
MLTKPPPTIPLRLRTESTLVMINYQSLSHQQQASSILGRRKVIRMDEVMCGFSSCGGSSVGG